MILEFLTSNNNVTMLIFLHDFGQCRFIREFIIHIIIE